MNYKTNTSWESSLAEVEELLKAQPVLKTAPKAGNKQLFEPTPMQHVSVDEPPPLRGSSRPTRHSARSFDVGAWYRNLPRYWWVDGIGVFLMVLFLWPFVTDFGSTTLNVTRAVLSLGSDLLGLAILVLGGMYLLRRLFRRGRRIFR